MPEIVVLRLRDLEYAHAILAEFFRGDAEPMPGWSAAERDKLETCVGCTEVGAFGKQKYEGLVAKTAKLFYSANKLHIFPNGNKRFGVVVTLVFLINNEHKVVAARGELRDMAERVAATAPLDSATSVDQVIERVLVPFFQERIEPL